MRGKLNFFYCLKSIVDEFYFYRYHLLKSLIYSMIQQYLENHFQ